MRNDIVFNGASPRIDQVLLLAQGEADLWMLAGTKGLSGLVAAPWWLAACGGRCGPLMLRMGAYVI
jgi:hypothetical protein